MVHVCLRVDLFPVGEEMRVEHGAVDLVTVVGHDVRPGRDSDDGLPADSHGAPGAGSGNQIAPGIQIVAISRREKSIRQIS